MPWPPRCSTDALRGHCCGAWPSTSTSVDALLRGYARGWALERMPVIDLNVLRIAAVRARPPPRRAHRRGAVRGGRARKRYSTAESGRFVNGVLAKVARELRPADAIPEPAGDVAADAEADPAEGHVAAEPTD